MQYSESRSEPTHMSLARRLLAIEHSILAHINAIQQGHVAVTCLASHTILVVFAVSHIDQFAAQGGFFALGTFRRKHRDVMFFAIEALVFWKTA